MRKKIFGIQQIGIGVHDAKQAWKWYREHFGMDINIFEEKGEASMMLPYTNGKPVKRYAALAMNMEGGGGFEIWQRLEKSKANGANFRIQLGDLGIYIAKIKSRDVAKAFETHKSRGLNILGDLETDPSGNLHYFIQDPYGNTFQVVCEHIAYKKQKSVTGGIAGGIIGVSNIEKARELYSDILQYDEVVYDESAVFKDFRNLHGGDQQCRRVLLKHGAERKGGFSRLFGPSQIELIHVPGKEARKVFENRDWGELGFIHLCFDVKGMSSLKKECESKGFPFTVDSLNGFDMGTAKGHFSYIEDPDGTLIEFVETHKIPIYEKLGLYINVKNRPANKDLPKWLISALAFNRIRK
jgi:catechol 2,3-dioxygenase-like lactoylglutathione lyase family enzyme